MKIKIGDERDRDINFLNRYFPEKKKEKNVKEIGDGASRLRAISVSLVVATGLRSWALDLWYQVWKNQ